MSSDEMKGVIINPEDVEVKLEDGHVTSGDSPLSDVAVKCQDDSADISINPLENVKVEYDETDDAPVAMPGPSLDPLANVEVEYALDGVQGTSLAKSRRSKDTGQSIVKFDKECVVTSVQCAGYSRIEIVPSSEQLKVAGDRAVGQKYVTHYACDLCSLRTRNKKTIVNHITKHENVYQCADCPYKTPVAIDYANHLGEEHSIYQMFMCEHCNFQSLKKRAFVLHMQLHIKGKQYECKYCPLRTARKWDLMKHMMKKHQFKIECKECNLVFRNVSDERSHIYNKHRDRVEDERLFCDLCDFTSISDVELTRHKQKKHLNNIIELVNYDMLI